MMNKVSYESMLVTAGACLLFPVLIPMTIVLVAYVTVAKAYSRRYHREYQ